MFGFRAPPIAEAPPQGYATLGPAPGTKIVPLNTFYALKVACAPVAHDYTGTFSGCYDPATRNEYLPGPGIYPDPNDRQAIAAHEDAHSWGLIHPSEDKGWAMGPHMAPGAPPLLTKAQLDYLRTSTLPATLQPLPKGR